MAWSWILALSAMAAGSVGLPSACAGPKECERNSDCDHSYCSQGECKRDCVMSSVDCPPGFECSEIGRCDPPAGWDGGVPDSASGGSSGTGGSAAGGNGGEPSQGGNAGTSTGGTAQGGSGGGPAGTGGGPSGPLKEFDNCAQDSDCTQGLVCRAMSVGLNPRCTRTCSASSQCMTGTHCGAVPPLGEWVCAFDDLGKPCSEKAECTDICMTGQGAGYCTTECASGAQCPSGWGCSMPIGGTRVCLRLDLPCGGPTDCAGHICDNQTLVVDGCTMQCSSAYDCPQRPANLPMWSCEGGVCFRPGDVYGPAGKEYKSTWACNQDNQRVNVCADGLSFDGAPAMTCPSMDLVETNSPCASSCLLTGGCGQGYACVSGIAALGNPPGVLTPICIRTGFVEIGQACAKNEDCLFGLCTKAKKCSRDCSADQVCPAGFTCTAGSCQ